MSPTVLFLNGTYLSDWKELNNLVVKFFTKQTKNSKSLQYEILAALRDGTIYDWAIQHNISSAENFNSAVFEGKTDSSVTQYLSREFGNRSDTVEHINFEEFIEILPTFSIVDDNDSAIQGQINGVVVKIPDNTNLKINLDFKVIKAANEELAIDVIAIQNGQQRKLDSFKIDTRKKGTITPWQFTVGDAKLLQNIFLRYDGIEILNFNFMPYNRVDVSSRLSRYKHVSRLTIYCDNDNTQYITLGSENVPLKKGENVISVNDYPSLSKGFKISESDNSHIDKIIINDLDTSDFKSMNSLFWKCSQIKELFMGRFRTSKVTNMSCMFNECSSLETLDLSSFDTSNVTSMGGMFCGCSSLETLDLSSFDTSKVIYMGVMFRECSSLKTLDLSSFDTSNVTSMGGMFRECSSLETLDLSSFDTSNVTNMNRMFYGCSSLTTINLSGWVINSASDLFKRCNNHKTYNSMFDILNKAMTNMFYGCNNMFDGCNNLRTIIAKNCSLQTVNLIKDQIYEAGLTNVEVIR